MGYAILRVEPRTIQGASAMLKHALRENVPANAIPGSPAPELLAGFQSTAEGMHKLREAVDAAKAAKRWQKSVKPVLDILVTFSHKDGETLSKEAQDEYFKRALAFVSERFGGAENVLAAAVHRDESTAHVQILMIAKKPGEAKLGASQFMGNRGNLHKLQNDFWLNCGKPFGLQRGEPRTGAKNLPVRQLYSALSQGAEVPDLLDVPPAPGMTDRLKPGYREKQEAHQKAIEQNIATIEQLRAQASRGAGLHPDLLAQQAERYRKAKARTDAAEKQEQEALKKAQESASKLARATADAKEMERYIDKLDERIASKTAQLERIDNDIDRLRNLRDIERNDYDGSPS